jgi:T-complex protein 1 subunit delta
MEVAHQLQKYSREIFGSDSYVCRAFGEALELIPYTLSENAGLNPIVFVTELRNRHHDNQRYAGLNIRKSAIEDMQETGVVQPTLVSTSAITLATECVRMILKIDDIVMSR